MPLNFLAPRRNAEIPTLMLDFTESLDSRITFARSDPGRYFDSAGVLQTAASGVARIKAHTYDGVVWNNRGFLIEEERENLLLQSEAIATAPWVALNSVEFFSNFIVAPDGTTTTDRMNDVITNGFGAIEQPFTIATTNLPYTYSLFVKKANQNTHPEFQMLFTGGTAVTATVQLDIGTGATNIRLDVGGGGASVEVEDLDDYWRIKFTVSNAGSNTLLKVLILAAISTTLGEVTPSLLGGINVWGQQLEQAPFATSYIKTTTIQVTRAEDAATMNDVSWFNETEGTFLVEASLAVALPTGGGLLNLDDGGDTNRYRFKCDGALNINFTTTHSADTDGVSNSTEVMVVNTPFRVIGVYADDDVRAAVNGVLSPADLTATIPLANAMTTLRLGANVSSTRWNGYIARIAYWNRRLPDGRLQDRTV